jgi:hypothetical protein
MRRVAASIAASVAAPAIVAPLSVGLALLLRHPAVLPVVATAAVYPCFARLLLQGRRGAAIACALLWAASLSATIIAVTAHDPERAAAVVLRGASYRDEMFAYVRTGVGRESTPRQFVPQHLLHAALFAVATLASAGLLGLMMGAVLVGYMSFYVGALASGAAPFTGALLGWPPWAVLRVVAFVMLGAVLSRPLLERLARRAVPHPPDRPIVAAALFLLAADMVLKAALAGTWAAILRPCLP